MASEPEWKPEREEKFYQGEGKRGEKPFRHRLSKSERIRGKKLISEILHSGKRINLGHLIIYYKNSERNKIGVLISKKVKGAVVRNRIKRLIKEAYRVNKYEIKKPKQIIFLIRKFNNNYSFSYFSKIIRQRLINEDF